MHILLCGEHQVGKSTLIRRLLQENRLPVYGFMTRMERTEPPYPVYIHPAGEPMENRVYGRENLVGTCDSRCRELHPEVFNGLGTRLIREARPGGILVMDELGFMEAGAEAFTRAVLEALEGDIPVIAAVKHRFDVPFLNAVRAMPKAKRYTVTPESREALYEELLPLLRQWNREGQSF